MADKADNKEFFSITQTSKKTRYFIIILLFFATIVLIESGYYFWLKKSKEGIIKGTEENRIKNPKDFSSIKEGEFYILGENENKKTICGKISDINGKILTIGSKEKVTIEITKEDARFYELKQGEKILPVEAEKVFNVGQIVCIGALEDSTLANYKAKLLVLTDKPMVLWVTQ